MLIIQLESSVHVLPNISSALPSNTVCEAIRVTTHPLSTRKQIYTLDFMWMYLGNTIAKESLLSSSLTRLAAGRILTRVAKYDTRTGSGSHQLYLRS